MSQVDWKSLNAPILRALLCGANNDCEKSPGKMSESGFSFCSVSIAVVQVVVHLKAGDNGDDDEDDGDIKENDDVDDNG